VQDVDMSWLFVDGIDEEALYTMLDLVATDVRPDPYDLGTSRVPLAGSRLKSGWSAVFAKYSLVMDAMFGTSPPRVARLPSPSRCLACVVLEHAMISYAGFWQDGRPVCEVRHDGGDHLEATGDLPAEFAAIHDAAMTKQRAKKPGPWGVDPVRRSARRRGWGHELSARPRCRARFFHGSANPRARGGKRPDTIEPAADLVADRGLDRI
jgi:hypothetical protein